MQPQQQARQGTDSKCRTQVETLHKAWLACVKLSEVLAHQLYLVHFFLVQLVFQVFILVPCRRTLRSWQGQTLEGISQGLSRSMHPSPDALMQPYSPTVLPQQQQQPYGFPHTHRHSAPLLNLRPATHLRNLASLGSPLATPTWLQGGTFQSPTQRQTHSRPPGMSQRRDESQSAVPRNTMRIPADSGAALRYGPPDPRDSLAIPADYDAGPSNGPSVPNNTLAAPADGMPASGDGEAGAVVQQQDSEEEDRLHVLSGSGVEEEVLEAELQALRAARQQFQRASLSQVHQLYSLCLPSLPLLLVVHPYTRPVSLSCTLAHSCHCQSPSLASSAQLEVSCASTAVHLAGFSVACCHHSSVFALQCRHTALVCAGDSEFHPVESCSASTECKLLRLLTVLNAVALLHSGSFWVAQFNE